MGYYVQRDMNEIISIDHNVVNIQRHIQIMLPKIHLEFRAEICKK